MSANSNYPMGVNGSSDYFNKPEIYCPICEWDVEPSWEFCPWCGAYIDAPDETETKLRESGLVK